MTVDVRSGSPTYGRVLDVDSVDGRHVGDPEELPVPVDVSLPAADVLFVDTFMDGKVRVFDLSDPHNPVQIYENVIGKRGPGDPAPPPHRGEQP